MIEEYGRARVDDPATAKAAARSVNVARLEEHCLGALTCCPMTSHELSIILQLNLVSVSPRLRPLVRKGLIKDSGRRRTNPSGRRAIVWELTS